jgi:hypothetical protein
MSSQQKNQTPMYNICCREAYPDDCPTHGATAWLKEEPLIAARESEARRQGERNGVAWAIGVIDELHFNQSGEWSGLDAEYKGIKMHCATATRQGLALTQHRATR